MDEKINFNKAERGGKPGVYQIENADGEKVNLVADSHPMADAYLRMKAEYVMTLEDWQAKKLADRAAKVEAKTEEVKATTPQTDKKGK